MSRTKALSYIALALALATVITASRAQAQYYTYDEVRRCEDQGTNTAIGVAGGLLAGGILGAVLGNGRPLNIALGAAAGGATGGLLGSAVSCNERAVYVRHVDEYLQRAPEGGYADDHCHVVVVGSGYGRDGHVCRTYHMDFLTSHGWVAEESTACFFDGRWHHGYDADIISRHVYTNPHPRFYYEVDDRIRDRQRMYWAEQRERREWERQHERDRIRWAQERETLRREREMRIADDRARARETVREVQWDRFQDREERHHHYDYIRDEPRRAYH